MSCGKDFERGKAVSVAFPPLTPTTVEVESAAARALKGRILNKRAHGALLRLLAEDLEAQIIVLPVSSSLLSEAAAIARRRPATRAGDALHIASAVRVCGLLEWLLAGLPTPYAARRCTPSW